MRLAKCLIAIAVLVGLAAALNVYLNPYSLHVFVYVDHADFNTPPGRDGVVRIGAEQIDFRAPRLGFRALQTAEIREELHLSDGAPDFDRAVAVSEFIRCRLNARDASRRAPPQGDVSTLLECGTDCLSQCGEHARLFWELMQLGGVQARMLWMEGHVAAEYFDRQQQSWVFLDPHLGVCLRDETGRRLSAAEAIRRLELDDFLDIAVFTEVGEHAVTWREVRQKNPAFLRNILLNGELVAYAGSVLVESGRWTHLLHHRRRPQVLVLRSAFDTSPGRYIQPLSWRSVGMTLAMLCLCFGGLLALMRGAVVAEPRPITLRPVRPSSRQT